MAGGFNFRMMDDPKGEVSSTLRTLASSMLWKDQQEKLALLLYIYIYIYYIYIYITKLHNKLKLICLFYEQFNI